MARTTTALALREVLEEALATGDVALVGESVGRGGGVAGTSRGLLDRFGSDVVIDVPVADRAALAFATGMAIGGRTVVVELSSTGRLPAVLEALAEAAAVASAGEFAVPLVVRVPYGTEAGERIDRPIGDLLALPGLVVACGSDPDAVVGLLRAALASGRPTVLLEPRALYDEIATSVPTASFGARVVRTGDHVTLAAWGTGVRVAVEAADQLAVEGISAEVIDLMTLAPLDRDTLGASVRKTGRIVAVHPDDASLAERVLRVGLDEAFWFLESPPASARHDVASVAGAARDGVFT